MVARAPGPFSARSIGDSGPRAVRRRPDLDAAISVLVERGDIEETCDKPRMFKLTSGGSAAVQCATGALLPGAEEIRAKHAALLVERHDLPERAAAYIAGADLRQWMLERLGISEFDRLVEMADDRIMAAFGCDPPSDSTATAATETRTNP